MMRIIFILLILLFISGCIPKGIVKISDKHQFGKFGEAYKFNSGIVNGL